MRRTRALARSVWSGSVVAALLAPLPASPSTFTLLAPETRRGGPIAQTFLAGGAENVSVVQTRNAMSCVASRALPIAEASYAAPDGTPVSFDDVTRSPAASIQAIARPGAPATLRVQLKYAPDPAEAIEVRLDGRTVDLADALEPSGDSLVLTGERARLVTEAFRRGSGATLHATSAATGRAVVDRVRAPDMAGLDACVAMLDEMPDRPDVPIADLSDFDVAVADVAGAFIRGPGAAAPAAGSPAPDRSASAASGPAGATAAEETGSPRPVLAEPRAAFRLEFTARPDPELRVDASTLSQCRMRNIPDEVFVGQLASVTGFFTQTRDVYVAFDDTGALERAYIPGIFDSDLAVGATEAHVSIAADSNLPDQANTVAGCLGDVPLDTPMCTISDSGSGDYTVAECGVLGMSQTREEYLEEVGDALLDDVAGPRPVTVITGDSRDGGTSFERPGGSVSFPPGGGFGGGGFIGGGGSGDGGSGGNGGDPGGGSGGVPTIPLPAAVWMLLLALAGVSGPRVLARIGGKS